jgi:hypothetical protein
MKLILESESTAFPPRLKEQPIFYPVLNIEYAEQIARDWNTKDAISDYAGYVTQFEVDADYIVGFEEHIVGGSIHKELWIPAVELSAFNKYIVLPLPSLLLWLQPRLVKNLMYVPLSQSLLTRLRRK